MKTKVYPSGIKVWDCDNKDIIEFIDYDQQAGIYTREEWLDELTGDYGLTAEEAENLCNILENTSNVAFFSEN